MNLFKSKKPMKDTNLPIFNNKSKNKDPILEDSVVLRNDGVDICAPACSICWDTKLPMDYEERANYIGKRSKSGHTSVLEHSNVVMLLPIKSEYYKDLLRFLDGVEFCKYIIKESTEDENLIYLLIGGSWRAFSDLYINENDLNNSIMKRITNLIYKYCPSEAFNNIINMGALEKNKFLDVPMCNDQRPIKQVIKENKLTIINIDNYKELISNIKNSLPYDSDKEVALFTNIRDLSKFLTVTVLFEGMSRVITQQLTRHRNAITQNSQRYVNYSDAAFNSPDLFNDKYDKNHIYSFTFGNKEMHMNLNNIGKSIINIYNQLISDETNPLKKEDARGFLPQNVECKSIYITFTYYNLQCFLNLREHPSAQAEIRMYAKWLGEWFRKNYIKQSDLTIPKYKMNQMLYSYKNSSEEVVSVKLLKDKK